jgi:hypothetical protein
VRRRRSPRLSAPPLDGDSNVLGIVDVQNPTYTASLDILHDCARNR